VTLHILNMAVAILRITELTQHIARRLGGLRGKIVVRRNLAYSIHRRQRRRHEMIDTSPVKKAKVGILYAGHRRYWGQFQGSRETTVAGARRFEAMVRESSVEVVMTDLVDTTELSFDAGRQLEESGVDLLFVYLHTYVASGFWVPGITRLKVPIVLVCLPQSFDMESEYITGTAIKRGSPCQLPEAYSALARVGREPADLILGDPDRDPRARHEIDEWCRVANALRVYRDCVIGHMGHSYDGMLDMNFDPTAITNTFGVYCKMLEMCELVEYVQTASLVDINAKIEEMRRVFDFAGKSGDPLTKPTSPEDIEWAARCAVGLDKLVAVHNLAGLAYYYEGLDNIYERVAANLIVGNTLLTSRGIALAGESDMKTCLAMKTTGALGAGGSFAEFSIIDFERDQVYVGHDGPHDLRITDGRPSIRSLGLYHGKRGSGIAVEFGIKKGDITIVSLGSDARGQFHFVVAEGQSMPGRLPQIGNTVTRGCFGPDVAGFIREWSLSCVPHHMSLCVGHIAALMIKLGKAMSLPIKVIRSKE
jgi:L-arabinose isomerase